MVTGQMSPAECEVARPMRPLDETGSSLLDPMWSVCPTRPVRQELPHRPDTSVWRCRPRAQGCRFAAPLTRLRP
jgi:hypothetical protein